MNNLFVVFLMIVFFQDDSSGQITFHKTYGSTSADAKSVQQTIDGGYIIAGYIQSLVLGTYDVCLIKVNYLGDTLWTKTFGGPDYDEACAVEQTIDGGYIISGYTDSFGAGYGDIYLIKTNSTGDLLWSKTYGGTNSEIGYSVQQTTDGGYIIVGYTNSFRSGNADVYLIKTTSTGDPLWTKTYGGNGFQVGTSVKQTTDGGYIISGYTDSFDFQYHNVYLIRTSDSGDTLWTKTYGGLYTAAAAAIQQTFDGGFIIAGYTNSFGASGDDVYLIKTDASGIIIWSKIYGGTGYDGASSVQQTADSGFIISGKAYGYVTATSDIYLIKTNNSGDTLWTKTFGGSWNELANSVQQTIDGGYIIAGYTSSFFDARDQGIYLIKTDSYGNSGCNYGSIATSVGTTATIVGTIETLVTSPNTIVTSPTTLVGGGDIFTTLCSFMGIQSANKYLTSRVSIFPNPSKGSFIVSFDHVIINGNIEILSTQGESIFTEKINNEASKDIHLLNITEGIYFVKVFDGEMHFFKKIIIEYY